MEKNKKLAFALFLAAFLAFLPFLAGADGGRYFVKSNKSFWKNTLGIRHEFDNGFTTEASDFQLRLAKIFGVAIEPVSVLQILPGNPDTLSQKASAENTIPTANIIKEVLGEPKEQESINVTEPEALKAVPTPKPNKVKSGVIRYFPADQTPWGIEVIYNDPSISSTSGGAGTKVAILDTGVATGHPDLKRRIVQCKDFTNFKTPILDGKCEDKNGHGTHVAGIVAADGGIDSLGIYGVAPDTKIFAYKVCGPSGSCYADDIAVAIRTAADQGANIINMSFGSNSTSDLIRNAVEYAFSKGTLLLAAAGNDGPFPESIDYPAAYPQVIAVGAINKFFTVTDWSSRGINLTTEPYVVEEKDIEFVSPGEYIESTWNNGGYAILSGTSMASPFVAGLAAKYWQADAADPLSATREFLHSLAVDLLPVGDDNGSGFGLPQVK